ncbi:alpha/beta hydrolase family protein [Kitasatospora sp. NPDC088391]|uniref:alpha/beta hydrolase family protein n=1 Tax=Kitasatospora sp. NPDC088391 TaxID=3364074 RepID=UPI00382B8A35
MTDALTPDRRVELPLDGGGTAVLRLPAGGPPDRPVPAVVLLQPFGAWNRDAFMPAEVSGNGPVGLFADLGAALVGAGIAAVSFDTRFVTEDFAGGAGTPRLTFTGMVDDAVRAVEQARAHADVDASRVALLGVSMGTEVALAAAERLADGTRLALVAPIAEQCAVFHRWKGLGRQLEWLVGSGFVDADGTVDLKAAKADHLGRHGWWDDFDLDERLGSGIEIEQLRAELAAAYDAWELRATGHGDESAPASFWSDWFAQPAPLRRLSGTSGAMTIHVGAEDWTTPPRHAWSVHRAAVGQGLRSDLTVHPRLGHLMSPRTADGLRTYGPFDPDFQRALVGSVGALLDPGTAEQGG